MKLPPGHVPGLGVHKATAMGGFGQKMLEKMGWQHGQGLGKKKHGMKEAIEVKKKEGTLGVGANSSGWKWDWKYWEDAYNTGLQSLDKRSKKRRKKAASSDSSSDSSSSGSDSSDSEDEHDARIAAALNRDGTMASAPAAELKLAKQLAKDPWGRFGGREGKMARIRQQEADQAVAMQAKLGLQRASSAHRKDKDGSGASPVGTSSSSSADTSAGGQTLAAATATAAAATGSRKSRKRTHHATATAADQLDIKSQSKKKFSKGEEDKHTAASPQQEHNQAAHVDVVTLAQSNSQPKVVVLAVKGVTDTVASTPVQLTPAVGWWGAKMFRSVGFLGGLEQQPQHKRQTFNEGMQANVYMAAHGAQRQGKRGIGTSSALKIAGGNWQGNKVTYDEEGLQAQKPSSLQQQAGDNHRQQQPQGSSPAAGSAPAKAANDSSATRKRKSKEQLKLGGSGGNKQGKIKWAKLAVLHLQKTPGGVLKWKTLWPQLLKAAEHQEGTPAITLQNEWKEKCWAKVQACSQLEVEGKLVSLAS